LGLHIRTIWATHVRPFIPVQAEPFEIFQSLTSGFVAGSGQVQIFHPKDDLAVVAAGDQPSHQKCACIAQMEPARGRWGEPADGL
jgi:predicted lipoprotein